MRISSELPAQTRVVPCANNTTWYPCDRQVRTYYYRNHDILALYILIGGTTRQGGELKWHEPQEILQPLQTIKSPAHVIVIIHLPNLHTQPNASEHGSISVCLSIVFRRYCCSHRKVCPTQECTARSLQGAAIPRTASLSEGPKEH